MRIIALLLCLVMPLGAIAEDVRSVSRAAFAAYEAKDWPAFLENAVKLNELRPNHPRVLYNLAGAYALNGKKDAALETLARVASMGVSYPAAKDDDFASIRSDERFAGILDAFEKNGKEIGSATVAFKVDDVKGAVPEGVALDRKTGNAWVSLVRERGILSVDPTGKASRIELPDPVWSVTGLTYDASSGTLWFCTAATPMMRDKDEEAIGQSSVVAWSVADSKVIGRWNLTADDAPHWLGDLTLASDGTVYTTDSRTPAIYRIVKGSSNIERWLTNENFASLQGLTTSRKADTLYVADYSKGIWKIDTSSGDASLLSVPADATVLGIDGLYRYDGDLIAIQNGTTPHRVIRLHLDADSSAIDSVETLEANRTQFDEPTLGVVQDGWFWFVATSGWGSFTDDGVLKEGAQASPVVVMKRRL